MQSAKGSRPQATLRSHRIGDLGWALERQAVLYHEEYRYLQVFEAHVAQGIARFLEDFDPARDAMWIAEQEGARVGCVAIHHDDERPGWAKLRWYFLERQARGRGSGRLLLQTALDFSRSAGYEGVYLWTVDDLHDARRAYEAAGFKLAEQTDGCAWAPWGHEQRWELHLVAAWGPPRAPSAGATPPGTSDASSWAPRGPGGALPTGQSDTRRRSRGPSPS